MKLRMEDALTLPFVSSLSFFNDKELRIILGTSRTLNTAARIEWNRRELLRHIVLDNQDAAIALIKADPEKLLVQLHVQDYSGRTIIATPFQAALGTGNVSLCMMMLPYLEALRPGEALKQFHGWFPNDIVEPSAKDLQSNYDAIAIAIMNDTAHGLYEIERFQENLTSQTEIRQGQHFNLNHLVAAYQTYLNYYDYLDSEKDRRLLWSGMIAYVQMQMSVYEAKNYFSALGNMMSFKQSPQQLVYSDLALEFAGSSHQEWDSEDEAPGYSFVSIAASKLKEFLEEKTEALTTLKNSLEPKQSYHP